MNASRQLSNREEAGCVETLMTPVHEPRSEEVDAPQPACRRPKVWVLTNAPSPYQVDLLSSVHRRSAVDLDVRFMRVTPEFRLAAGRSSTFSWRELWGAAPRSWRDEFRLHPGALREAALGKYDCFILSGLYTSVTFLACAAVLTLRRKPWAVWLERPRADKYRLRWGRGLVRGRFVQTVKQRVLRSLLRRATRIIGMGSAAVQFYRDLGVPVEKLSMLPYCCDVERFGAASDRDVENIRRRYRLEGKTVFLFSGQMIERKGVDVALSAFTKLAARHADVALVLLGDGPRRREYENSVPEPLRDQVHFTGLLNQPELPAYFSAADVFVFPSRHDGWGVVVNEACGAGLPVIASRQTGAALDLVDDGRNGFLLDCEDVDGFAAKMELFVDDPEQIRQFGLRSRELVQKFSSEEGARRFQECALATIGRPQAESFRR